MQLSQLVRVQDITAQNELEVTEDRGPTISHCLYVLVTDVPIYDCDCLRPAPLRLGLSE